MDAIAINGSPRKGWNTHRLLTSALEGASYKGYVIELIHLSDLSFKGCTGCLSCKYKGGNSLGICVLKDDLSSVLKRIELCDLLVIGSPLYFSEVTGMTRSFIERLLFQSLTYDVLGGTLRKKRTPTLLAYTANMSFKSLESEGLLDKFTRYRQLFTQIFGPAKTIISCETLQTNNYDNYHMEAFDSKNRHHLRKTVFPIDCMRASNYAVQLAEGTVDSLSDDLDIILSSK